MKRLRLPGQVDDLATAERDISASAAALTAAQAAITQAFRDEISTDYYAVLVFQNGAQLETFVRALALKAEDRDPQYLSGTLLAKRLGIELPPGPYWKDREPKSSFAELALYLDEDEGA